MVKEYGGVREIVNMGTGAQHGFSVGFLVGAIYYKRTIQVILNILGCISDDR